MIKDMIRVAIPVSENNLSERFERCSHYSIYEIDDHASVSRRLEVSSEEFAGNLPESMQRHGITDVIAHGIDKESLSYLAETKINVFVGVNITDPEHLIEEYLKGSLRSDIHELID